jgi:hypothetical protein
MPDDEQSPKTRNSVIHYHQNLLVSTRFYVNLREIHNNINKQTSSYGLKGCLKMIICVDIATAKK